MLQTLLIFSNLAALGYSQGYSEKASQNGMIMSLCGSSNTPEQCIDTHFLYKYHSKFTADCSDTIFDGPCSVTIAIGVTEDVIAIIFKGSSNINTFKSVVSSKLSSMPMESFETFGKVGKDFKTAFQRLWDAGLGDTIMELWGDYCEYSILIVGHSTGACLGQLVLPMIESLQLFRKDQLIYYGYGAPRCGDQDFAYSVDKTSDNLWRVNWIDDNVVNMPSTTCGRSSKAVQNSGTSCWFHCCNAALAKKGFLGIGLSFTKCTVGESTSCTGGSKTPAHYTYWDTKESQYDNLICSSNAIFTVNM